MVQNATSPQIFTMQDAISGTARVRAGETAAVVQLATPMPGKYQVLATPMFNVGALWAPNQTATGFTVQWERALAAASGAAELHWEVWSAPWPGNPTPKCCTEAEG